MIVAWVERHIFFQLLLNLSDDVSLTSDKVMVHTVRCTTEGGDTVDRRCDGPSFLVKLDYRTMSASSLFKVSRSVPTSRNNDRPPINEIAD